jgi:uncharacterized protein YjbI with pentapeptide repeats
MFRIFGLFIAISLLAFSFYWSAVPQEERAALPGPVNSAAEATASFLATSGAKLDEWFGPMVRRAMFRVSEEIDKNNEKKKDHKPGTVIAMNLDLARADYAAQHMPEAAFTNSVLTEANFTKAYMKGAAFDSAEAGNAVFDEAIIPYSSARGTNFTAVSFVETDMTGITAQGAIFDKSIFAKATLTKAQMSGASFVETEISDSWGERGIYYAAIFTRATLQDSQFPKTNFDLAVFQDAVISGGNFSKARFREADFSGADLSQAPLSQQQLDEACGDDKTLLAEGLTLQTCVDMRAAKLAAELED